jgi:hypothetical protein
VLRLVAWSLWSIALLSIDASAECVTIPTTVAQRLAGTPLVFVGDVLAVEEVILDPEPFVYRVRFRVLEAYKGTTMGERTFDLANGPDEFRFVPGHRVLVYASPNKRGKFSTGCAGSRDTLLNDAELVELRRHSEASSTATGQRP